MVRLTINGKSHEVDVDPSTPLLWVIREQIGLTGTKYGCGMAQCGSCTVHVNGAATRSCVMPVSAAVGQKITTIEGLASGNKLHKVQAAWIKRPRTRAKAGRTSSLYHCGARSVPGFVTSPRLKTRLIK